MKNAIALGSFDGVHLGHQAVLNLPSDHRKIAVTFKAPPKSVLTGNIKQIYTTENKCRILRELGIDEVVLLKFDEVRDISPEFFLKVLKTDYNPSFISFGFNYRFGKGGSGTADTLIDFCQKNSIDYKCESAVTNNGEIISSTEIRRLLANGEIEKANELLYKPFCFEAAVIEGDQRGRTIGFPTINQKYPEELVNLKFGVYKTKVFVEGEEYHGITNIGIRPTYESDCVLSETHIKNFSGNLYGKTVKIVPQKFLREERKFGSLEELKEQITKDFEY